MLTAPFVLEAMFLGFLLTGILIVGLELLTGYSVVGWSGRMLLADRRKFPGPYWFSVAIHIVLMILVPALMYFGR